jgi:hypothetical protein
MVSERIDNCLLWVCISLELRLYANQRYRIFVIFFVNSLQQQTTGNLYPYVTSSFYLHSLVSTISIVSNIVGGVFKLPIAKLLDMWGRAEGFALMLTSCMIGEFIYELLSDIIN